jgi:hypothetical protein
MGKEWRTVKLVALLVLLSAACSDVGAAQSQGEMEVVSGLLERFETIFRADRAFLSYEPSPNGRLPELMAPFANLRKGLRGLGEDTLSAHLVYTKSVLVGARNFHAPKGLGSVKMDFCYVVFLQSDAEFDFRKYPRANPIALIGDETVFHWIVEAREFEGEKPIRIPYYGVVIANSLLLISNSQADLNRISSRLKPGGEARSSPKAPEWQTLNGHSVWGYRKYRHGAAASFADRAAAGLTGVTPSAKALLFYLDKEKRTCTVRLFTTPTGGRTPMNIDKMNGIPRFRETDVGIWESRYSLDDEYTNERTFFVMALFGFGVYL